MALCEMLDNLDLWWAVYQGEFFLALLGLLGLGWIFVKLLEARDERYRDRTDTEKDIMG